MIREVESKTGKRIALNTTSQGGPLLRVLKRTEGNRIARIQIGDRTFSGRDIRMALNLPSSDFSIHTTKKYIKFISHGYGHGVGMSQWGANLMAQSGKSAQEIIFHYYQGVKIEHVK
jgi:stage II sporulation protein D